MADPKHCVILHPDEQAAPAIRFGAALGLPCRPIEMRRFPDGETLLRLPLPLPSRAIVYCTLGRPDRQLVELMLAARTAREHGVSHLTLVAPYLCYMRQDKAFHPGEAVSQTIVGGFLARLFDAVVTVDPHLHRIDRLEQAVPASSAIALTAARGLGAFVARTVPDALLVGPDAESAQWAAAVAAEAGRPHRVFAKERRGDRDVGIEAGDASEPLSGRRVVLVDDIASSGRTLAEAARVCLERGARSVDAVVTHALCAAVDLRAMHAAGVGRLWSSDSLPHPSNQVPLAPLLAAGCREHGLG
jgi:ribose-phosphate pyrophosphokinase